MKTYMYMYFSNERSIAFGSCLTVLCVLIHSFIILFTLIHSFIPSRQVNGVDVSSSTHEEAIKLLVTSGDPLKLLIRHEPPPEGLKVLLTL